MDIKQATTEELQVELDLRKGDYLRDALAETLKRAYGMNASYLDTARKVAVGMSHKDLANFIYSLRFARSQDFMDGGAPEYVENSEYKIKLELPEE